MGPDRRKTQPGYYLTGQVVAAYNSRERIYAVPTRDCLPDQQVKGSRGPPASGISQSSTCICLPARSPALRGEGRALFEQPGKDDFLSSLLG